MTVYSHIQIIGLKDIAVDRNLSEAGTRGAIYRIRLTKETDVATVHITDHREAMLETVIALRGACDQMMDLIAEDDALLAKKAAA